jgi:hypothetical protein
MTLKLNCIIDIPGEIVQGTAYMTPKEITKFHDDLTKFINDNWEVLNKDED